MPVNIGRISKESFTNNNQSNPFVDLSWKWLLTIKTHPRPHTLAYELQIGLKRSLITHHFISKRISKPVHFSDCLIQVSRILPHGNIRFKTYPSRGVN